SLGKGVSGPLRLRALRRGDGTLPQCLDLLPERLPLLALGFGQLGQGRRTADAGEIRVLLPVLHSFTYHGAGLVGLFVQQAAIRGQVGPQPVEGLTAEASTLPDMALSRVFALTTTGQGGSAGGVVAGTVLQVVSQLGLLGKSIGVETGRGGVERLARQLT